jgi:hypothetical protein
MPGTRCTSSGRERRSVKATELMTAVRSLGPSELYIPFSLHECGFPRSLIPLLCKLQEEISVRITVNVAEDRLAILCALICVVEATTTIEISSE